MGWLSLAASPVSNSALEEVGGKGLAVLEKEKMVPECAAHWLTDRLIPRLPEGRAQQGVVIMEKHGAKREG